MTKRKFYIIKTLIAVGLAVFVYFYIDFVKKNQITDERKPSDLEFAIICFSALVAVIIFIIGVDFLCLYQRPKFPEEIEKEMRKERWRQMVEEIPIEEIMLSTGEKIRGKFLEKDEYFEEVESENRYYKTFIVKVEKIV